MSTSKSPSQRRYPPELHERAVRMVREAIAENGGERFGVVTRYGSSSGQIEAVGARLDRIRSTQPESEEHVLDLCPPRCKRSTAARAPRRAPQPEGICSAATTWPAGPQGPGSGDMAACGAAAPYSRSSGLARCAGSFRRGGCDRDRPHRNRVQRPSQAPIAIPTAGKMGHHQAITQRTAGSWCATTNRLPDPGKHRAIQFHTSTARRDQ